MIQGRGIVSDRLFECRYEMPTKMLRSCFKMKQIERQKGFREDEYRIYHHKPWCGLYGVKKNKGLLKDWEGLFIQSGFLLHFVGAYEGFSICTKYQLDFAGRNVCSIVDWCIHFLYRFHPIFWWSNHITCQ